jgi:hypothetical protein
VISAFTLAERVKKISHKDQNRFIKHSFIGNNIRLIDDIIEYAQRRICTGSLVFLDFTKAFDSTLGFFSCIT